MQNFSKTLTSSITGILLLSLMLGACSATPTTIRVSEAWARPAAQGNNGAVYFSIENNTATNLSILSASSSAARAVEIHRSSLMSADELDGMIEGGADNADLAMQGVMQMMPVDTLDLPSGQSQLFEPGGLHVMLIDLAQELKPGDTLLLTLSFDNADNYEIEVLVEER